MAANAVYGLSDRSWRRRPRVVVAAATVALVGVLAACGGRTGNPSTSAAGMADLTKTWHNTAPAAVQSKNWSWPIVRQMTFSQGGRWDFTLSDGTSCHADYQLTAVSDSKADISTKYFKCPPFIDGYLGSPTPYPLEIKSGQLMTSGAGTATFVEGPASAPPSSAAASAESGSTAPDVNPVGKWHCVVTTRPHITIDLTVEERTWSAKFTDTHGGPIVAGTGNWDGTDGSGRFTGTVSWSDGGSKNYSVRVDWTINGFKRSEVIPFIVNSTFSIGNSGSTTVSGMKESKRTVTPERVQQDSELQPYVRENDKKITSPNYFQGADQFMINLQLCNRTK